MNAHQRRKARRAKGELEPFVIFVPADPNEEWMRVLTGLHELASVVAGVPLIRGEIGTIEM